MHSFSSNWIYDDYNHWKTCSCGVTGVLEEHSYGEWYFHEESAYSLRERTCTVCGYTQNESSLYDYVLSEYRTDYILVGLGDYSRTDVIIPTQYNGLPIWKIGEGAFSNQTQIVSIYIPETVNTIGDFAFCGCSGLTEFKISSETILRVGKNCLQDCPNLKTVFFDSQYINNPNAFLENTFVEKVVFGGNTVPEKIGEQLGLTNNVKEIIITNNVTGIGSNAFAKCLKIKKVSISDSVTSIGSGAFSGCTNLENISIPNGVTSIFYDVFKGCSNLKNITLPSGLIDIWSSAFSDCISIESIIIPDSVTRIDSYAFSGCSSLESIILPEGVTQIGSNAFAKCSSLSSVYIPNSLYNIGDSAFSECSNLESITIPNDAPTIGGYAFYKCTSLKEAIISNTESLQTVSSNAQSGIGTYAFAHCYSLEEIKILNGIRFIGKYAFMSCNSLESITIPNSLIGVNENAFEFVENVKKVNFIGTIGEWCVVNYAKHIAYYSHYTLYINGELLTNVVIPDGVTCINDYVFASNWKQLESITIPNSVTKIGDYAFSYCTNLTEITIPNSVTSFGTGVFVGCRKLVFIYYNGTISDWCKIDFSSSVVNNNNDNRRMYLYINGTRMSTITIPDEITVIKEYTFAGFEFLSTIVIPKSITKIEKHSFDGCKYLSTIYYTGTEEQWSTINGKQYVPDASTIVFEYVE